MKTLSFSALHNYIAVIMKHTHVVTVVMSSLVLLHSLSIKITGYGSAFIGSTASESRCQHTRMVKSAFSASNSINGSYHIIIIHHGIY